MDPQTQPTPKKLIVGWFSFTCCEDSTILLTELLNDNLDAWKKVVEFKHIRQLKSKNETEGFDVAFIEGAISSDTQAAEVKKIRNTSKYVVAIGSCACTGLPSATRNNLDPELYQQIKYYMEHFDYSAKVRKLEEVITVDDKVNGCPMSIPAFTAALDKYLKLFNIIPS